jgi:uncharacterized membrane protein
MSKYEAEQLVIAERKRVKKTSNYFWVLVPAIVGTVFYAWWIFPAAVAVNLFVILILNHLAFVRVHKQTNMAPEDQQQIWEAFKKGGGK